MTCVSYPADTRQSLSQMLPLLSCVVSHHLYVVTRNSSYAIKSDTIQLRFPVIYSKTNPCTHSYGHLRNCPLRGNNDKENKKTGGERRENQKQLWTHSIQGVQPADNATRPGWHSVAFLSGFSQKLPQIRRPLISSDKWNYKTRTWELMQALSLNLTFLGSQVLLLSLKKQVL